ERRLPRLTLPANRERAVDEHSDEPHHAPAVFVVADGRVGAPPALGFGEGSLRVHRCGGDSFAFQVVAEQSTARSAAPWAAPAPVARHANSTRAGGRARPPPPTNASLRGCTAGAAG